VLGEVEGIDKVGDFVGIESVGETDGNETVGDVVGVETVGELVGNEIVGESEGLLVVGGSVTTIVSKGKPGTCNPDSSISKITFSTFALGPRISSTTDPEERAMHRIGDSNMEHRDKKSCSVDGSVIMREKSASKYIVAVTSSGKGS